MQVNRREDQLYVFVADHLTHVALLGQDMPGIWELRKRLLHDELVNMLTTKSHIK